MTRARAHNCGWIAAVASAPVATAAAPATQPHLPHPLETRPPPPPPLPHGYAIAPTDACRRVAPWRARRYQAQQSAKQMVKQGTGGRIVVIGSIMADFSAATAAAYSMAKCATREMVKVAANEVACHDININMIQPGYIDTPGERRLASEEELRNSASCIPLRRLGTPRDIGQLALFLCSDQSTYITGSVVDCDGGFKVSRGSPAHVHTCTRAPQPTHAV